MQYTREERLEDLRYLEMSDLEYSKYFNFRLLEDRALRPGIGYLIALKDAKLRIREEKFVPVLHFQYLKKFADFLKEKEIPLWIVNNPENPISLDWYKHSNWYEDHLLFLKKHFRKRGLVQRSEGFSFHAGLQRLSSSYFSGYDENESDLCGRIRQNF